VSQSTQEAISTQIIPEPSSSVLCFYLVAGEASGDILGQRLMLALKSRFPNATFKGIGGELMAREGLQVVYPMERLSVMGVIPIVKRLIELLGVRRRLARQVIQERADCFIGIDAPVFNTHLEFKLKNAGIKTVHYVSPSVWAWRENRIYKIVKSVSLMICLFPFELAIYKQHKLPAVAVGHPLADEIPLQPNMAEARKNLGLPLDQKIISILPGSRGSELKFLLEPFLQSAAKLAQKHQLKFVVPCANQKRKHQIDQYINDHQLNIDISTFLGQSRKLMLASDVVLLASGTATLEAMLLKKPMLVAYKVSPFSYWIYTKFLKINNFSLPNLLAGKSLVTELMQQECSVQNIVTEMELLIEGKNSQDLMAEYLSLHQSLKLNGSEIAATAIAKLLQSDIKT
jgi:lipid-A-disaccharide synthase